MKMSEWFTALDIEVRAVLGRADANIAFSVDGDGERREYSSSGSNVTVAKYNDHRVFIDGIVASPDPSWDEKIGGERRLFRAPHHNRVFEIDAAGIEYAADVIRAWLSHDMKAIEKIRNSAHSA